MLDDPAEIPNDFSFRDYFGNAWSVYKGEHSYDIEVRFTPDAARVITETVWHHTQTATSHKDGSVTLRFQVDGLEEIVNSVMSWTGRVEVLQPPELRELVVKKLKSALNIYQQ